MTRATNYRRSAQARGDRHCQVVLTAEAHAELVRLVELHRLDRREVVERLILGIPLDRIGATSEQERLGMSNSEYRDFLRVADVYQHQKRGNIGE